jgi:hypothetical protein
MPNWCSNDLEIKGSPKEIKRFRTQAEAKTQPKEEGTVAGLIENFFAQFVPIPADIYTGNVGQEEEKKYGKKNWYDWCPRNWGTKWDACECHVAIAKENQVVYCFDTAWSPPIEWLEKVAKLYPKLHFKLKYDEPGMVFSGTATGEAGIVTDDFHDGVSPMHAEMDEEEET